MFLNFHWCFHLSGTKHWSSKPGTCDLFRSTKLNSHFKLIVWFFLILLFPYTCIAFEDVFTDVHNILSKYEDIRNTKSVRHFFQIIKHTWKHKLWKEVKVYFLQSWLYGIFISKEQILVFANTLIAPNSVRPVTFHKHKKVIKWKKCFKAQYYVIMHCRNAKWQIRYAKLYCLVIVFKDN